MNRPDWRLNVAALITGLLLVPARLFLSFFPVFNLAEVMMFAVVAALLAYCFSVRPSWWVALLFLPVWLSVLFIVASLLGMENLRRGIGVGHAVSLALIPLSALCGAHYGGKLACGSLKVRS